MLIATCSCQGRCFHDESAILSAGERLFGRLLRRGSESAPEPEAMRNLPAPAFGLQIRLDDEGRVSGIDGTLRHALAPWDAPCELRDLLLLPSRLCVEGVPADWLGQSLDLDFNGPAGQVLHVRAWVQPGDTGWWLQAVDIGDLLEHNLRASLREQLQHFAGQMSEQLRLCSLARLPQVLNEQLQGLSQRWRIPCVALALLDEHQQQWTVHSQYRAPDAPALWQTGQVLGRGLDSLNGMLPLSFSAQQGLSEHMRLQAVMGNADGLLIPFCDDHGVAAWLLAGFYPIQQRAAQLDERDWLQLAAALAAPLLARLRQQAHHHQLERLEVLQSLLGTGWWEWTPANDQLQLAPQLARGFGLEAPYGVLSLEGWLGLFHAADRQELSKRMHDLQQGKALLQVVRRHAEDPLQPPQWYRLLGQVLGVGDSLRIIGFVLDTSDVRSQE